MCVLKSKGIEGPSKWVSNWTGPSYKWVDFLLTDSPNKDKDHNINNWVSMITLTLPKLKVTHNRKHILIGLQDYGPC